MLPKFRVWYNVHGGKMYPVQSIRTNKDGSVTVNATDNTDDWNPIQVLGKWQNGYLMQYTGLKDKNGKEIYEGDIVTESVNSCKWIYEVRSCEEFGVNLFKVVRYRNFTTDENGDQIGGDFWVNDIYDQLRDARYITVIGNIYENLDLIVPKDAQESA